MPTATQSEELVVWTAPERWTRQNVSLRPIRPVSDASLQHKNCLGREFGNLLSAHLGHDFRVISPAVYRRFLRVWTAST
jgi:hypothetical protein